MTHTETCFARWVRKLELIYLKQFLCCRDFGDCGVSHRNINIVFRVECVCVHLCLIQTDVDGGGGVDYDELKTFCFKQFGESDDVLLRHMFREADEDGSGEIELDEFVHIMKKVHSLINAWADPVICSLAHVVRVCWISATCQINVDGLR